jgi:uncharacterized protein (DUF1015 family)
MVDILPFNGLRFDIHMTGELSKIIAPPYDIITPLQKQQLKDQSPYNIVNLTLPDDSNGRSRYENAKITLQDFIEKGILKLDTEKCLYIFEEFFIDDAGGLKSFTGLLGLLKVEDYGAGKVLRHEKTLSKPKEDRLNLLKACRTNFEFIYTLYNDSDAVIFNILDDEKKKEPLITTNAAYEPSLKFKFWKVSDKKILSAIIKAMKSKTLLIADGHHRYETSKLYRESIPVHSQAFNASASDEEGISKRPEDYILSLFVSANQKDISIHPTHRLVKFERKISPEEMLEKISKYFAVEIFPPEISDIYTKMSSCQAAGSKAICIIFDSQTCYFAVLKTDVESVYKDLGISPEKFSEEFENLDVNILHKLILSVLLKDHEIKDIKFIHTVGEVLDALGSKTQETDFDAGFILNAPSIETVENLSNNGLIMPQKSTYFYPKPCSGLVMYAFDN